MPDAKPPISENILAQTSSVRVHAACTCGKSRETCFANICDSIIEDIYQIHDHCRVSYSPTDVRHYEGL